MGSDELADDGDTRENVVIRQFALAILAGSLAQGAAVASELSEFMEKLTPPVPGAFPAMPEFKAGYSFGWSNTIEAATAEIEVTRRGTDYQVFVEGGSLGFARLLWKFDAEHWAWIDAETLRPDYFWEYDRYRSQNVTTSVRFLPDLVWRQRTVDVDGKPGKWKRFEAEGIFDILGGLLFVRSQPLKDGDTVRLLAYPGDSPFVVRAKVEGRETIEVMGKSRPAIRLSMELRKIEVKKKQLHKLVDYEKFRGGQVWISDDELRVPLRAEMSIFIGFVYGELVSFEELKQ